MSDHMPPSDATSLSAPQKQSAPRQPKANLQTWMSAEPKIELWRALLHALLCCCPRCGRGSLFRGMLEIETRCIRCGLSYDFADSGDGPAVFVILIGGFIALGAMLWIAASFDLSPFIQFFISLPVVIGVCLLLLRPFKALLIGLQYRNQAQESRFTSQSVTRNLQKPTDTP